MLNKYIILDKTLEFEQRIDTFLDHPDIPVFPRIFYRSNIQHDKACQRDSINFNFHIPPLCLSVFIYHKLFMSRHRWFVWDFFKR